MDLTQVRKRLIEHEGIKLKPYHCTAGKLTIGVGRNLDDRGISQATATQMLEEDIEIVLDELKRALPFWEKLKWNYKEALVDLAFNMGVPRLMMFRNMLSAIEADDPDKAAEELLDSRYASQVGVRASNIAGLLRAS
jgi:lysozyme